MEPATDPLGGAQRYQIIVAIAIVGLIIARLVVASLVPLAFDEALYWRWSQHLAFGNLDHPPMTPLLIRAGTAIFGDTPFGVRVMVVLLSIPASMSVWRAAARLFVSERIGATAALYFNLTLAVAAGSVLATPDFPVVTCSAILLFLLAKLSRSDRGEWWLAIGAAFGIGMFTKYSMLFFAPSILIWLLVVPRQRRWLFTIWPWIGGLVALAVFSPVLLWNEQHGWASVLYQSHRLVVHQLRLPYIAEYPASQLGLATPSIFILGCMAMTRFFRRASEQFSSRVLISALVLPIAVYFLWHSLHGRVEGNWPMPMYPAFAVAAAVAAESLEWRGFSGRLVTWSRQLAAPISVALAALIYLQAVFGIIPFGHVDPTARALGAGWPQMAMEIDGIRERAHAPVVLAADYGVTSWLSFYLPSHTPVEQIDGRMRWINEPAPDQALFDGPMVFVCQGKCSQAKWLAKRFKDVELISTLNRMRNGVPIVPYEIYRVAEPIGATLDAP
jgi:4-amino-4-deoxy-L-arabinose transferase-like glycosyltransferase